MYLEHFKLHTLPFSLTPNTQFFCNLPGHQDALNVLLFSLKTGEGFIKIVGEVGAGKTLICRTLLNQLGDPYVTAYLPNPDLDPQGLRLAVAQEFGLVLSADMSQAAVLQAINEKLLSLRVDGKRPVLIIDEAQVLPDQSLEAVRLLTNLETESEKLLQIVLFGQPELDQRLDQYQFRQLQQRITFSHRLQPLTESEMEEYICHRLSMAGYTRGTVFDKKAYKLLYQASLGVPRVINVLCHKAMLSAFGRGDQKVNKKDMQQAVADSADVVRSLVSARRRTAGMVVLLIAVAILALLLIRDFLTG